MKTVHPGIKQLVSRPKSTGVFWDVAVGRYRWQRDGLREYHRWQKTVARVAVADFSGGGGVYSARSEGWTWDDGARLFFWRWAPEYLEVIRDGLPIHMLKIPPLYDKPQANERCEETRINVRARGYITPGKVKALTAFFSVQKGEDDITRVVYDGSISGLNEALWVPRFILPTLRTHLRAVEDGTFMAGVDIGEMFLNFMLHEGVRPYAVVDLTHYFPDGSRERVWEAWGWAAMGLTSSPFQAVQGMAYAEEVILVGDRKDPENPFCWDWIRMNLPGQVGYDPSKPWVSKIREEDG
jgi:hypothetical protein